MCSSAVLAQSNQTVYSESIQIKADNGQVIANIDTNGRLTLSPSSSAEEVVNLLIRRMVSQNIQYKDQIQILSRMLEEAKFKSQVTCQKLGEIYLIWNPPSVPVTAPAQEQPKKEEVKKEEPKIEKVSLPTAPVAAPKADVKKEDKGWLQKIFGG